MKKNKKLPKRQMIRKIILFINVLLFPIVFYYFSPVIVVMGAYHGVITSSIFTFMVLFIASLYFGRSFCGWICGAGAIQESCIKFRKRKVNTGKGDLIKIFVIWLPWLTAIILLLINAGGINKVDITYMITNGIFIASIHGFIVFLNVLTVFVLMSLVIGKRASCHYICWMSPFMIIGTKLRDKFRLPGVRLHVEPDKCIKCGICSEKCSMSIKVKELVLKNSLVHNECILCGSCVDYCPKQVISFSTK